MIQGCRMSQVQAQRAPHGAFRGDEWWRLIGNVLVEFSRPEIAVARDPILEASREGGGVDSAVPRLPLEQIPHVVGLDAVVHEELVQVEQVAALHALNHAA